MTWQLAIRRKIERREPLTCGDLAILLGHPFRHHELARQDYEDPHCQCWREPQNLVFSGGSWWSSASFDQQECRNQWSGPTAPLADLAKRFGLAFLLCCSCFDDWMDGSGTEAGLILKAVAALRLAGVLALESSRPDIAPAGWSEEQGCSSSQPGPMGLPVGPGLFKGS